MDFSQVWVPLLLALLAGLSTAVGSLISFAIKDFKKCYLCISLGLSAGVMIYVSFAELMPTAFTNIGFVHSNIAFFAGVVFIMAIDFLIPHDYIAEHTHRDCKDKKLAKAGTFTAIGIAIHNFPEGLAVLMAGLSDINLGIALAIAIAIHNIPEGISISMPIYYATKSKKKAFGYSLIAGLAEPVGALLGALILLPFLTPEILNFSLAFVAGIMVFISFDELLPIAYNEEKAHLAVAGIFTGMAIMSISLMLI
jgi:zinc transporter, ZIP family